MKVVVFLLLLLALTSLSGLVTEVISSSTNDNNQNNNIITGHSSLAELIKIRRSKLRAAESSIENASTDSDVDRATAYNAIIPQLGSKESDKISTLPGQPEVSFGQYSGYVTVDPNRGRALFYYFAESGDSDATSPLVLWLNGGPGCSSFGAGAMMELGPFRVNPDGMTLWINEYSWNNLANILFLESPAGVGFSYSNASMEYGDKQTASDSYTFLVNWLERFPEYKMRDFYIAGESFAGHYVPQLASLILRNNEITNGAVISLKGIAIGNAEIDFEDEERGIYDYLWTHALISDERHDAVFKNCDFSSFSLSDACYNALNQAFLDKGSAYIYDIYAHLCSSSSQKPSASGFDPCSINYVSNYLNAPEVQRALHANVTSIVPGPWNACNNSIFTHWSEMAITILPTIKELMASGIRVWIYSGDTDGRVPVTSTKYSMVKLDVPVLTPWYPWYSNGQVGGYVVGYQNVTFVTVRGSGHFVPSYQPQRAFDMFASFLQGKLPPRRN